MGNEYYFYNKTIGEKNKIAIDMKYNSPLVSHFGCLSREKQIRIFENIIDKNHWKQTDDIIAEALYGNVEKIYYRVIIEK